MPKKKKRSPSPPYLQDRLERFLDKYGYEDAKDKAEGILRLCKEHSVDASKVLPEIVANQMGKEVSEEDIAELSMYPCVMCSHYTPFHDLSPWKTAWMCRCCRSEQGSCNYERTLGARCVPVKDEDEENHFYE